MQSTFILIDSFIFFEIGDVSHVERKSESVGVKSTFVHSIVTQLVGMR